MEGAIDGIEALLAYLCFLLFIIRFYLSGTQGNRLYYYMGTKFQYTIDFSNEVLHLRYVLCQSKHPWLELMANVYS